MKNKTKRIILIILFFMLFGVVNAADWVGPTDIPPRENTDTPLNVGSEPQIKAGYLYFPKWIDVNDEDENYYVDPHLTSVLNDLYLRDDLMVGSSATDDGADMYIADKIYDWDDIDYYIDPSETSKFNVIDLGGVEKDAWPEDATSLWAESGSNIYRNDGNVGIGTTVLDEKLNVKGNLNIESTVGSLYTNYTYIYITTYYNLYSPRCSCDTDTSTIDCLSSFVVTVDEGSYCFDQYNNYYSRYFVKTGVSTEGTPPTGGNIKAKSLIDNDDTNYYVDPAGSGNGVSAIFAGNIGIGTTVPEHKLDVVTSSPIAIEGLSTNFYGYGVIGKADGGGAIGVYGTGGGYGVFGGGDAYGVYGSATGIGGYFTSSSGSALITGTGNVGIGTTIPEEKLDVVGNIKASGTVCDGTGACVGDTSSNFSNINVSGLNILNYYTDSAVAKFNLYGTYQRKSGNVWVDMENGQSIAYKVRLTDDSGDQNDCANGYGECVLIRDSFDGSYTNYSCQDTFFRINPANGSSCYPGEEYYETNYWTQALVCYAKFNVFGKLVSRNCFRAIDGKPLMSCNSAGYSCSWTDLGDGSDRTNLDDNAAF